MSQKINEILDLNTINIVLGRSTALLSFVDEYNKEKQVGEIENELLVLPYGTYHHSNYEYHFKGACAENLNPIIITQNKEFLNTCINASDDPLNVVSYDFNIIQLSFERKLKKFVVKVISKKEAIQMLKDNPKLELRDF